MQRIVAAVRFRLEVMDRRDEMPDLVAIRPDDGHADRPRFVVLQTPHVIAVKDPGMVNIPACS